MFIGAGKSSGVKVGDILVVNKPGKQVKNPTTGAMIQLPGTPVGKVQVVSQFGNSPVEEGSICTVLSKTEEILKEYEIVAEGK